MPTLAEKLTPNSSDAQIKAAISNSIQELMQTGRKQEQAVAIAFEQAKKATGKELAQQGG